jgi:hypothetical protein
LTKRALVHQGELPCPITRIDVLVGVPDAAQEKKIHQRGKLVSHRKCLLHTASTLRCTPVESSPAAQWSGCRAARLGSAVQLPERHVNVRMRVHHRQLVKTSTYRRKRSDGGKAVKSRVNLSNGYDELSGFRSLPSTRGCLDEVVMIGSQLKRRNTSTTVLPTVEDAGYKHQSFISVTGHHACRLPELTLARGTMAA